MPRKSSSTIASGGKGYTFADKVAARLLAQMLARSFPLEADLGLITEVHFETKESGRSLDDLHVILKDGATRSRWSISVKSNRQLSANGFNNAFVADAWSDWRGQTSSFDKGADQLGLITGVVGSGPLTDWEALRREAASTTPERLLDRIDGAKQISAPKRTLFTSLYPNPNATDEERKETARLAAKIHVQHFSEARDEGNAINECASLLRSGEISEARKLWSTVCQFAADSRGTGGYFDIPKLLQRLRSTYDLTDYPDYRSDWNRLDSLTKNNVANIRSVLGNGIRLDRDDEIETILASVRKRDVTVVAGESGSGKSAIISRLATKPGEYSHVVWITPAQLSKSSQNEISLSLGLSYQLPELIAASASSSSLLVIDAVEKFEGEALARVEELLRAVQEAEFAGWKILLSCHLQSWERTQRTLLARGVTDLERIDLQLPSLSTIHTAVQSIPAIGILLLRPGLQPLLRNLLVLDWVIRTNVGATLAKDPSVTVGETDVINSIWTHWIEKNRRLQRDRLLRSLGEREGEAFSGAVSIDLLQQTELTLLEDLSREDIVRIDLPYVKFTHDLIGDWARFRSLVASPKPLVKIKSSIQIPRWNRAIRLYAQSLLEGKTDLSDWQTALGELSGADAESKLARDLFLEAILFAANSLILIESVWTNLISDSGQLLNRLMDRLLLVASFPDTRLRSLVSPKDAEASESWFRIPMPIYWIPGLSVFASHADEVADVALAKSAEVCVLFLRSMPPGMPGRESAANLALVLARKVQDQQAAWPYHGRDGRAIYEALLLAASESPDEVAQVALEVAGRRPEPNHAIAYREEKEYEAALRQAKWKKEHPEEDKQRRASARAMSAMSFSPSRRVKQPLHDGPQRRIPEAFREAVMDRGGLSELITRRPNVAGEILLSVCLEDPGHREHDSIFGSHGLERWGNGYPPIYFKGPFHTFLQRSPSDAIETIVKLSNIVTHEEMAANQINSVDPKARERFALKFSVDNKTTFLFGNGNVYNLHRGGRLQEDTLACALMALEKWFYDELASGRSIDAHVQYIFENATSLAFAGVLIAVGMYNRDLFHSCLRPLLQNVHIYECQKNAADGEQSESWQIGFAGRPELERQLAVSWNRMPHRRTILQDLVPTLRLENVQTETFLKACADEWAATHESSDADEDLRFELFLTRFNGNTSVLPSSHEGLVEILTVLPEAVEEQRKTAQAESEYRYVAHAIALKARGLLNAGTGIANNHLASFFAQLQLLPNPSYPDRDVSDLRARTRSIAGGLAVLFIFHREWVAQQPSVEAWCFETLRNLPTVEDEELDRPESGQHGINTESFLGEIGVFLLQERNDEWILRMAFEGVTGFYYASTLLSMWRAYLYRAKLGTLFSELLSVALLWSAVRRAVIRKEGHHAQREGLKPARNTLFERLTNRRIARRTITLPIAATLGARLIERIERRDPSEVARRQWEKERTAFDRSQDRDASREMAHLDYQVLEASFYFLSHALVSKTASDQEIAGDYTRQLFHLLIDTLPLLEGDDEGREISGTAYQFDIWVMQRTGDLLATLKSVDDARPFFEPILKRGPAARYWTQDFLEAWIINALPKAADRDIFVKIWNAMIDYTFSLPAWIGRRPGIWFHAESLAVDLMGLRESALFVLGHAEYVTLVGSMAPAFKRWGDQWLKYGDVAAWFANFLSTDSGQALLVQGVEQLGEVVISFPERDWERGSLATALTQALAATWKSIPDQVASRVSLKTAFLRILTELCARSVPEAIHLRDRVSQIMVAT